MHILTHLVDTIRFNADSAGPLSSCLTIQVLALVYASAILTSPEQSRRHQLIHQARFKMHEYEERELDLERLASEMNVSYVWFRKEFKRIVGTSPGQYHLNLRIKRAMQLLKETDLPVGQIAARLGFESDFHFSKIFRQKAELSPSQYRKSITATT
jgi:transcriptional regulator GlxA family with amidase domain